MSYTRCLKVWPGEPVKLRISATYIVDVFLQIFTDCPFKQHDGWNQKMVALVTPWDLNKVWVKLLVDKDSLIGLSKYRNCGQKIIRLSGQWSLLRCLTIQWTWTSVSHKVSQGMPLYTEHVHHIVFTMVLTLATFVLCIYDKILW